MTDEYLPPPARVSGVVEPEPAQPKRVRPVFRCGCVWDSERCPNAATQEDGLCDWCAPHDARSEAQLRANPKAIISPITDEFFGIGGGGELHDSRLTPTVRTGACWYPNSGRTIVAPAHIDDGAAGE